MGETGTQPKYDPNDMLALPVLTLGLTILIHILSCFSLVFPGGSFFSFIGAFINIFVFTHEQKKLRATHKETSDPDTIDLTLVPKWMTCMILLFIVNAGINMYWVNKAKCGGKFESRVVTGQIDNHLTVTCAGREVLSTKDPEIISRHTALSLRQWSAMCLLFTYLFFLAVLSVRNRRIQLLKQAEHP